jgi:outer membrane protein
VTPSLVCQRLRMATAGLPLAAALVLLAAPLAAQQVPPGPAALSLEGAVRLAAENNPALQQQRNARDVARSSVRSAYGDLLPTASVTSEFDYTAAGERRFGSVELARQPDYYGSSYQLGLNYNLSGATLMQPSVERSQERAAEKRVVGAEANLVAQVSTQYLNVLQAREQVAQAEREVARTMEHVRLAQARLEVGAGTPLDVRRAEVQKGRAEVGLVQARTNSATQMLTLSQLLGLRLDPATELTSQFAIFQPNLQADELVQVALGANPTLLAARAGVDAAQSSVQAARSAYLPSLSFRMGVRGSVYQAGDLDPLVRESFGRAQASFQQCVAQNDVRARVGLDVVPCGTLPTETQVREQVAQSNSGFPFGYARQPLGATLSFSLPLFTGFDRQLQIDRARATASDARFEVRANELRLMQEVGSGVLTLEGAYQAALLQEEVRANAEEELRLAQERFRFGAANSIEVTDAQTNLAQAERDKIDAIYDFHKALAALEALVGQPLR